MHRLEDGRVFADVAARREAPILFDNISLEGTSKNCQFD